MRNQKLEKLLNLLPKAQGLEIKVELNTDKLFKVILTHGTRVVVVDNMNTNGEIVARRYTKQMIATNAQKTARGHVPIRNFIQKVFELVQLGFINTAQI